MSSSIPTIWRAAGASRPWPAGSSARASTAMSALSRRPARKTERLFGPAGAAGADRLDVHGLDVDELANAEDAAFAAVARMLDSAEGRARVGTDVLVDEAHAGFELLGRDAPAAVEVRCEHARAEPELAGVGDADRVRFVVGGDDRRDGAEHFLVMGGL